MLARFQPHLSRVLFWLLVLLILTQTQSSPARGQLAPTLEAPVLSSPENDEWTTVQNYPPLATPTFVWQPVAGATLYQLQINTDPFFSLPNVLEIHTANLQYTPLEPGILPDGLYYWRVRVEEPLPGSSFSISYQFQKNWVSLQNAPLLIAPPDNAYLAFFDQPGFTWEAVSGAVRYRFQIASSADGFAAPVYQQDTAGTQHQPENKLTNGRYYWRVLPIDPVDNPGMPSAIRAFDLEYGSAALEQIPTLLTPGQNAILQFTPAFSWTAIPGAQSYWLEYTPGPICDFTNATSIETNQTSFSPTTNHPNHGTFCWRVRVQSGLSTGDWSEVRVFSREWDLESQLLTPTHGDHYARTPLFNWTPVAGAATYLIELDGLAQSDPVDFQATTTNPFWTSPGELPPDSYTWQVTPFDSDGHAGATSQAFQVQNPLTATVPSLVYPFSYYLPDDPSSIGMMPLNPVEDRTAAYPVFVWQRVFNPSPFGGLLARAYRLQVSSNPYFSPISWELDTENTTATPTLDAGFSPTSGQDYYWRVCPLDLVLPICQVNPANGDVWWSETRKVRFDPSLDLPAGAGEAPQLLLPSNGHEQVEGMPIFEWQPVDSVSYYHLQISRDAEFTSIAHEAYPLNPVYASPVSLAQRNLGKTDYGTFYWRVRGMVDGEFSPWSDTRRFQVASQSEWRRIRVLGNERNRLLVGSDLAHDSSTNFELSTLYISQANLAWYFGFNAGTDPVIDMTYVIFIDTDHLDESGATFLPERPYLVSTIGAHQPEYVLYIDQVGGQFSAQNTWIYTWMDSSWSFRQSLSAAGGALIFSTGEPGYLELELPDSAMGVNRAPDSISTIVISINSAGVVLDSVPSDPNVPGSAILSRFTSVSDRMNLVFPPDNPDVTTGVLPTLLPLFWDWPTGADPSGIDPAPATPYAGAQVQIALDPLFSTLVVDQIYPANAWYVGTPTVAMLNDLAGDATYYWRVRPRYLNAGVYFGAWSAPHRFTRHGFSPTNLRASTQSATPELAWDNVAGAAWYQLQISTQADFDPLTLDITTANNTYTPVEAFAPGTYYWRVGVQREGTSQISWSDNEQFSFALPVPAGLSPDAPSNPLATIPTLCWESVIGYLNDLPISSAWKYHLQVSSRVDFLTLVDNADTEMHCWTPVDWYPQGMYYWHVAMLDGAGHMGGYSPPAAFSLQYPAVDLISPISGWIFQTPNFSWAPVPGTAYYRLEVSQEADFYPLFDSALMVNIQYTPLFNYPPEQDYFWRVAAYNASGYPGSFTSTNITIGSPKTWLPMIRR